MSDSPRRGLFARLSKTRQSISAGWSSLFGGAESLTDGDYDDLEDHLIMSDMGAQASMKLSESLRQTARRAKVKDSESLKLLLRDEVTSLLEKAETTIDMAEPGPLVIFMVGVNGVGKTTTTAKLARYFQQQGKQVMLAACDTFRAAAIEQLQQWGQRLEVPVIAQQHGSDAAAVAHDALSSAISRGVDVLLIDSAGRQHVNADLMEQLAKVVRVLKKVDARTPQQVWLTVDAGNGQNVLSQIDHFRKIVPITGLCVTKLDGTAKGGVLVAVAEQYGLPVPFIGVGEGMDDLRRFQAREFADALLDID